MHHTSFDIYCLDYGEADCARNHFAQGGNSLQGWKGEVRIVEGWSGLHTVKAAGAHVRAIA